MNPEWVTIPRRVLALDVTSSVPYSSSIQHREVCSLWKIEINLLSFYQWVLMSGRPWKTSLLWVGSIRPCLFERSFAIKEGQPSHYEPWQHHWNPWNALPVGSLEVNCVDDVRTHWVLREEKNVLIKSPWWPVLIQDQVGRDTTTSVAVGKCTKFFVFK